MKYCFTLLFALFATVGTAAPKMNVVFILIDDLSHYGVSAYGAEKIGSVQGLFEDVAFETPRMDSLAD
ncbi:sulfatase, partial [bacterium]|nr:sulfatase [bacterium]